MFHVVQNILAIWHLNLKLLKKKDSFFAYFKLIVLAFCIQGNKLATPILKGTILPGITRKSIIELARSRGYEVNGEISFNLKESKQF